jgi:predicted nucleic acid-binding protein
MSDLKRTYVDACLLIAAFKSQGELGRRALDVLDDPGRLLIVSDAVWLEVMPKPQFHRQQAEAAFYETIFERAQRRLWCVETLHQAYRLASLHGIAAMDAIHVAIAMEADAEEFVTAEKPTKPMFRVPSLLVRSIR